MIGDDFRVFQSCQTNCELAGHFDCHVLVRRDPAQPLFPRKPQRIRKAFLVQKVPLGGMRFRASRIEISVPDQEIGTCRSMSLRARVQQLRLAMVFLKIREDSGVTAVRQEFVANLGRKTLAPRYVPCIQKPGASIVFHLPRLQLWFRLSGR